MRHRPLGIAADRQGAPLPLVLAGTGITDKELKRLAGVLAPLQVPKMPLADPPPRDSRFGSPLKLSRVHWVRPEVVPGSSCFQTTIHLDVRSTFRHRWPANERIRSDCSDGTCIEKPFGWFCSQRTYYANGGLDRRGCHLLVDT
jgi:hypothetical protein